MLTLLQRSKLQTNIIGKRLFEIMEQKQTNLAVSADVTTSHDLLSLAKSIGPKICVLKTHMDIVDDINPDVIHQLTTIAKQYNFLIFEDRKFADIGNTVRLQYQGGPFKIASWSDITNFHIISGVGVLDGLIAASGKPDRGFLVISQMSSETPLITSEYTKAAINLAQKNCEHVIGFICQNRQSDDPRFLHLTPGVSLEQVGDSLGQQYRSPEMAIIKQGCDIIIVGRAIIAAHDISIEAEKYRAAGWSAYLQSLV